MLNLTTLEQQLKSGFEDVLLGALEQTYKCTFPGQSSRGDDMAKVFGETGSKLLAEPLAKIIAAAIDYYVKNISISGTLLTTGSPVTQQAIIQSPTPVMNGIIPNSFKIS